MDRPHTRHKLHREEITAIQIAAICRNGIDLIDAVGALDPTAGSQPVAREIHHYNVTSSWSPFALDPEQMTAEIEGQVVAAVLDQGFEHVNPNSNRRGCDLGLGNVPLVVCAVVSHEHMFEARMSRVARGM